MTAPPATMPQPQEPFRLVLTPEQSAAIRESGIRAAVGLFDPDPPDTANAFGKPARATLYLFACSRAAATAAGNVAVNFVTATPANRPRQPHDQA